jgi:hypothetical protein
LPQDVLAKRRQLVLAPHSVKQGLTQFILQRFDASAKGWLGKEKPVRRFAERAIGSQLNEVLQLNQGHRFSPCI